MLQKSPICHFTEIGEQNMLICKFDTLLSFLVPLRGDHTSHRLGVQLQAIILSKTYSVFILTEIGS